MTGPRAGKDALMTKKAKPSEVIIDPFAAATDWDALPSLAEILTRGPPPEIRVHLDAMGRLILGGNALPPGYSAWLGAALIDIAAGADAKEALRVKGKARIPVSQIARERYLVQALREQGLTEDAALRAVSSMSSTDVDWDGKLLDVDRKAALEQRLKRSRKPK